MYLPVRPNCAGAYFHEHCRLTIGVRGLDDSCITFDHVYTFNSTTIFNWSVAWNRFSILFLLSPRQYEPVT